MKAFIRLIAAFSLIVLGMMLTLFTVIDRSNFKTDYRIDLLKNDYLIKDNQGNTHHVKKGHLEEWFLQDNL